MPKVKRKWANATQWNVVGDHTDVQAWPVDSGTCVTCGLAQRTHGYIRIDGNNITVCPGDYIISRGDQALECLRSTEFNKHWGA